MLRCLTKFKYNRKTFILWTTLFFICKAYTQTSGLGTWNVVNGKVIFNSRWNAFFEAQIRSQKTYKDFSYHEYKGGVGYNPGKNMSVLLAIGQYVTYSPVGNFMSPVQGSEFRLWEQFSLENNIGRFFIDHRYRIEQRFIGSVYRNRFRYRLGVILPVNKSKLETNTIYFLASEEVFFTDKNPYFEQNRFLKGAGYMFSKSFSLQLGHMSQFNYRVNSTSFSKSYIQASLLFTLNTNNNIRSHPGTED